MSNKEDICNDINSFGSAGIKKTDLKKKYNDENFENLLNELISDEKICVFKKGTSIYCWNKESYLDYLLSSDIKFKYLFNSLMNVQTKLNNYSDSIFKYVEKIDCELAEVKSSFQRIEEKINNLKTNEIDFTEFEKEVLTIESFKEHFDKIITEKSTSIGWVELSLIKQELCSSCNITDNEFYSYVSNLTETYPEKYELSSGGYEGVVLRGIVHGFVRVI